MKVELIRIIRNQLQNSDYHSYEVDETVEALAIKHDVAQFVYASSENLKKLKPIIARMICINNATQDILDIFEKSKISHIPLKGAAIRPLYPEFWMRTSCDVDILVHEYDLDRAVEALKILGYRVEGKKNYHDISLFSKDGVHLELHFNIRETIDEMDEVLEQVWDYAVLDDGYSYRYKETPEFFLFHHIAHMAYHFVGGGCGIRPFIDLYILEQNVSLDYSAYKELIKRAHLEKFSEYAFNLMHYWFGNKDGDDLVYKMEKYILQGGVYGTTKQSVIIKKEKNGGKFNYFMNRIFMPYRSMVVLYPVLKKHRWLLPFMEIHRWFKVLLVKDRIANEMKLVMNTDSDYSVDMMQELGL